MTMQNPPKPSAAVRPLPVRGLPAAVVLLLAVTVMALPATGQGEVADPSTSQSAFQAEGDTTVVDFTFPFPEGEYDRPLYDGYDDARGGGRIHRATDIMSPKMVPVHAVVAGEICFAPDPEPSYGWMIRLCGDDGYRYAYVHLNNDTPGTDDGMGGREYAYAPGIEEGMQVERGEHIGWVGDSGNAEASGSHLHFEIAEDGGEGDVRINPHPSLEAAEERGDFPDDVTPAPQPVTPSPEDPEDDDDEEDGPPSTSSGGYTRLAGGDRISTAVVLSEETRQSARTVIIVPADSHVEALVAAPLAGLVDAPILLAGPDGLAPGVSAEIERLEAPNAYLIGSQQQLSSAVEEDLADAGVRNHARITASDRFSLSAAVAEEMLTYPDVPPLEQVILALGDAEVSARAWPDALSASALAAHTQTPVLLTNGVRLSDEVTDLLSAQRPDEVLIIGGTAAISDAIAAAAAAAADGHVTRLAGATRYATSVAVAEEGRSVGLTDDAVWVATGLNFPDALAAGPAAALAGSPLVLVDGLDVAGAPDSAEWLQDNAEGLLVVGGESVVTDAVAGALAP